MGGHGPGEPPPEEPRFRDKRYLGDGLYASHDGFSWWLTAENGISITDRVCLEPEVYDAFLKYVEDIRSKYAASNRPHAEDAISKSEAQRIEDLDQEENDIGF